MCLSIALTLQSLKYLASLASTTTMRATSSFGLSAVSFNSSIALLQNRFSVVN